MLRLTSLPHDQRLIYMSMALWGFGMSLFIYIQPLYVAHLGASAAQIGMALGLSGLVATFIYIPIGFQADRRGRKPTMLAGWSLGTAATFAMALAPDWRWFIPAIGAYQLSNFAMPAFYGYVAASNRDGNLSRTFATIAGVGSIGAVVAPALGGWIGEQFGLRAIYLLAAVAFGASTLAIWKLSEHPVEAPALRISPRQLLSSRLFVGQMLFILLLFFAVDLGSVMLPRFLRDVRGMTLGQIGWLGTIGSLGVILLTLVLGSMPDERRGSLILGQFAALAALVLILSTPVLVFVGLAYFIHGSNRVVRPIVSGRLAHALSRATLSLGFGFRETAMRLGLAVAPYVAGLLYARDPTWPLYAGIFSLTLTLLLTFALPSNLRFRGGTTVG